MLPCRVEGFWSFDIGRKFKHRSEKVLGCFLQGSDACIQYSSIFSIRVYLRIRTLGLFRKAKYTSECSKLLRFSSTKFDLH